MLGVANSQGAGVVLPGGVLMVLGFALGWLSILAAPRAGNASTIAVDPEPVGENCIRCGGALASAGVAHFRTGGTTGGWKLLFGEMAELGEGMLPLEVLVCQECRNVEFRAAEG